MYVFGGGDISVHLVQFAKALDFAVVLVDDREEFANKKRFPQLGQAKVGDFVNVTRALEFHEDDIVVVVTRGHEHDEDVLKECLSKATLPGYIGWVSSRERVTATFGRLKEQGITEELLRTVKAPVGISIGARTPAEIALSITAQIIAHQHGRSI